MYRLKLCNKSALILLFCACMMNIFFLSMHIVLTTYKHRSSYGLLHPNVAYNICKYGTCKLDANLHTYLIDQAEKHGGMLSLANAETSFNFSPQEFIFPVNDTIGYGLIFALLWKITNSFTFLDIQILQILLFSLLMLLHYQIGYMLFASEWVAFFSGIAHLLFFPILAMNIHAVRDIWAYYGLIILLYYCTKFFTQGFQVRSMLYGGFWLAFFQCIRPTLFAAVVIYTVFFLGYALIYSEVRKNVLCALFLLYCTNISFFWLPFMAYNKITYDRYIVGPLGQDLIEGLGEFSNKWGFKLDDTWLASFLRTKYGHELGTPEADNMARKEFQHALREDSLFYLKTLLWRLPQLLLPGLPWLYYAESPYPEGLSWYEKIIHSFSSVSAFLDFFLRQLYVRTYLIIGYAALVFTIFRKNYFASLLLLICGIAPCLGKFPSHLEYRYLIPYYWIFSFFIGNAMTAITFVYKKDVLS